MELKKLLNIDFFLNIHLIFKPKNSIPDFQLQDISQLTPILEAINVGGLVFDIDQTILPYRKNQVSEEFSHLLKELSKTYKCCLLSNFVPSEKKIQRTKSIEKQTNIPVVRADKKKPAPEAFQDALDFIKLPPDEAVMIGDRIFTDIIGANHIGMKTVLVKPLNIHTDPILMVTLPRFFENLYLKLARLFFG